MSRVLTLKSVLKRTISWLRGWCAFIVSEAAFIVSEAVSSFISGRPSPGQSGVSELIPNLYNLYINIYLSELVELCETL